MATNYGDTIFEDSLTPEVPIVQPVDNKAGEYLATGLSNTINNVNSILFNPNAKAARAESAKNSLFSEYAEEVSLLSDAKDQGMSTDEAQRRLRVLQNTFLGNNPELADDFFTFSNKLMTENGLGGVIHKETPIETANRKKTEDAVAKGWNVSTPQGMAEYDRFLNNSAYLEQLKQKVDMTLASGQLLTAQTQAEATVALHDMVASTVPWVNNLIATTTTQLKSVSDPVQRQALIDQAKAKYGQQAALLGGLRSQSKDAINTEYLTAATDQLMKVFEEVATGKSDLAALTTANELAQAKANAIVFVDPKLAALIALDKASKFSDPNAIRTLDQAKLNLWAKLNKPQAEEGDSEEKPADIIDKADNVALIFDELKKGTTNIVNDSAADPEAKAAQSNKIVNTLRSIVTFGTTDQDAKNFTSVVDFLADTSVGKFIEQNKSAINPQIAQQADYVLQQQYGNIVQPLINERWLEAQTQIIKAQPNMTTDDMWASGAGMNPDAGIESIDINKAIEPVWNGAGIEFRATEEFRDNAQVRAVAKSLNTGPDAAAPAINKLVRMQAHLEGTTDYKKIYDERVNANNRLFLTGEDTEKDAGKELDTLTNIPEAALKGPVLQPVAPVDWEGTVPTTSIKGEAGGLLDAIGEAEGANYNTLFGYAEREGGDFAGTDITKMTIGEVMRLQRQMVSANGISSAVGKYQFIQDTLREAVAGAGLSPGDIFSPENQDKLALWLLRQRTDFDDWVTGQADAAKFQNQLAGIWASVPNTSGKSTYASDGINKASSRGKKLVGML